MAKRPNKKTDWPDQLFSVLRAANVKQVAYVPDAGHAQLIKRCSASNQMRAVALTSEQEGCALLAGAWLGGERGVLLMQSSGVGNCVNMLGMIQECRFPLLMIVTMRGQWGEFNPWQIPMGQSTSEVLKSAGVIVQEAADASAVVETVESSLKLAFDSYRAAAVLISQRVIGTKTFQVK
ncbi:MAG: phosphonopyruvate decarboxylase [Gammaproteobacteria bacterium]|nr:phosphonopyruvate decarboxylase [Gammaproteobacteria bacterium]